MMGMGIKRMVKFLKDTEAREHYSTMRENDDLHTQQQHRGVILLWLFQIINWHYYPGR